MTTALGIVGSLVVLIFGLLCAAATIVIEKSDNMKGNWLRVNRVFTVMFLILGIGGCGVGLFATFTW